MRQDQFKNVAENKHFSVIPKWGFFFLILLYLFLFKISYLRNEYVVFGALKAYR